MNVTDDGDGGLDVDDVALPHEQLFRLFADLLQEGLAEELLAQEDRNRPVEVQHRSFGSRMLRATFCAVWIARVEGCVVEGGDDARCGADKLIRDRRVARGSRS